MPNTWKCLKRIAKRCARIGAKWIRLVWKRASFTWTKVYLLAALVCLVALAVTGEWFFIVVGVMCLLLAVSFEMDRNERLARAVLNPYGLQTMILIETGCLAIAVVSTVLIAFHMQDIHRLIDDAQSIEAVERLYQELWEAETMLGAFVTFPTTVLSIVPHTLKTHKENPFVIELKLTPIWKYQRVMPVVPFVANTAVLIVGLIW